MPNPHPFAATRADKGRARAVLKPAATVYGYTRVSTGGQSVEWSRPAASRLRRGQGCSAKWQAEPKPTAHDSAQDDHGVSHHATPLIFADRHQESTAGSLAAVP